MGDTSTDDINININIKAGEALRILDQLSAKGATVGSNIEKGSQKATSSIKGLNVAWNILAYDIVRNAIQAVTQFFKQSIDQATQLEATLYRLKNAERILSGEGIQVTMQGFQQGIKDIKTLLPIFSKEDISQMVGAIAISTKQLGLTEEQILNLARAAAIYNVQSVENETLLQSQAKLVTAIISPQAKSIGDYGIAFSKVTMEAKALELGILRVGESVAKLTDAQKAQVKYAIIMEGADANLAGINEYLDSNTAKLQKNTAAWKDLQTSIGQVILPFLPTITAITTGLSGAVTIAKVLLSIFASLGRTITAFIADIPQLIQKLVTGDMGIKDVFEHYKKVFQGLLKDWLTDFFPEAPTVSIKLFDKLFKGLFDQKDTPTAPIAPDVNVGSDYGADYVKAVEDVEKKVADIMQEAADKKLDIEQDYQEKREDIARDYARKMEDIARNTSQDIADAQRDYGEQVSEINQDANQQIAEVREEGRTQDIEAERQYQDELAQLRERYLLDLEDALHERDARQILRLMRQYQIDKQNAQENFQQEREENARQTAERVAEIEQQRQERLRDAQKELQDKLRDIRLNAARERQEAAIARRRALEDARIAYNRQLADHREYLQRKLRDLQASIQSEYQLTAAGMNAINSLFNSLTGMGSPTTSGTVASSLYTSATPTVNSAWATSGMYGTTGLAEGGSFLATKPTTINVAENRPELVSAMPLGRPGQDLNKLFMNAGMGGGSESGVGQLELGITLSPDLEARVINKSMDAVGNIIMKVNKSKI